MKVTEIWRYPVKSMLGEPLNQTSIAPGGIDGDRRWAVVDAETGVSLSAKRYSALLGCRAWTSDDEVIVELPSGHQFPAGSSEVADGLSDLLGRQVTTRSVEMTETIRHEFPTAITEGEGEPLLWEPGTEAYFDRAPLHLITTSTLEALHSVAPDSFFERARFRPNFLVEAEEDGFIENDWIEKDVMLGSLKCRVLDHKPRCVMVTRAQDGLPQDIEVIRTVLRNNDGNAGVELRALEVGTLKRGDEVRVLG